MQIHLDEIPQTFDKVSAQSQESCTAESGQCLISLSGEGIKTSRVLACHRFIFKKIASLIGRYRKQCIGSMLTFAFVLSCGNILLNFNDDFRSGYSQLDPQSEKEHAIFLNFSGLTKQPYMVMLVGESIDGGSILREEQFMVMRREIMRGLDIQLNGTRNPNSLESAPFQLRDRIIFSDEPQFALIETSLTNPNPHVNLSYPVSKFYNQKVLMARAIYGYRNGEATMLAYYFAFAGDDVCLASIKKAELLWSEQLKANDNNLTKMRLFGDAVVNNEISQGAFGACPYFVVGSLLMIAFVFVTVRRYQKKISSGIYLTFWTIFCPLLAGSCAFAIIALLGIPVNCVMLITPFLVLGVGVDDAFLMMHHWFISTEVDHATRLRSVMIRIGPSITLTSFTNITAFLIGSLLSAPDLQLFCFSAALAFALDWFFQLFLFNPVLLGFKDMNDSLPTTEEKKKDGPKALSLFYFEWLRMVPVRAALLILLIAYWVAGIQGGLSMKENFSPEKTFDSESFLAKSLAHNEEMFYDHEMIRIFICDVPDDVEILIGRIKKFREIEYLCEDFPTWIEEYETEKFGGNKTDTAGYFQNLGLYASRNPSVLRDVRFDQDPSRPFHVERIAFDLCVHGFGSWRDRALMLQDLRSRMPEGFSVYLSESAVLAMIVSSRTAILKSVVITVSCMGLICLLFVPSVRAATAAIISVASITIGVIGGLYIWGADLDTMVLVNVVMAVGLTVDFSAHISYYCFSEETDISNPKKFAEAVQAIAIPAAEAALTTVICVIPLYFYSVYIYVTFAKTVFLIAAFGLIHTVFVVPLIISLL